MVITLMVSHTSTQETENIVFVPPKTDSVGIIFAEPFLSATALENFIPSTASKDGVDDDIAKYDGKWEVTQTQKDSLDGDLSLIMKDKAKHHAIAAQLDKPFQPEGKPLVFQYEVKFQTENTCGGAYVKLLSQDDSADFSKFHDKTPYTIMFGPDRCGTEEKFHFILRHVNPISGSIEEKHAKKPNGFNNKYFDVGKTHVYRLVVHPDSSFEMSVDREVLLKGHLLSDMTPGIIPEEMIDDASDSKPEDWDEREKIPDPEATKPEDWNDDAPKQIEDESAVKPDGWLDDEETMIPDSTAEKPADWDDEMDGEWEAPLIENALCKDASGCGAWTRPMIDNPEFKGKWKAPLIANADYKGIWAPKKIKNPEYFEEPNPFERITPIAAIGLELWTMSEEVAFDNFILADNVATVDRWTDETWGAKVKREGASAPDGESVFGALLRLGNENPALWGVYVIVILLPIVLIYLLCCRGGSDDVDETADDAARRKKTDEPTADVPLTEDDKEEDKEALLEDDDASRESGSDDETEVVETPDPKAKEAPVEPDDKGSDEDEKASDEDEKAEGAPVTAPASKSLLDG